MKILIVGGTGALGGHAAIYLASKGHVVTVAGRNAPHPDTPMAKMHFLLGDYISGEYTSARLKGFDWVVFAAANDPRHVPPDADFVAHLKKANHDAVPAFMRAARDAGVKRVVQLGSYYHQAAPSLVAGNRYIQSRKAACDGARAEARPGFAVISVNAPFMVGTVPRLSSPMFTGYTQWAQGKMPVPPSAPGGGTNFMSYIALSEALEGALERGESGKAYLVGDEDLSFVQYFELFFAAVGNRTSIAVSHGEHPMLPDIAIPQGRGNWVRVNPDPVENKLLGYRRADVANAVQDIVVQFRSD